MYQKFFKRLFDIIVSLTLMILFSPLFILIAILIMIYDGNTRIFYNSTRVGKGFKHFKFYKFRTMKCDCQCKEVFVKDRNDDRVTKIGKYLRRSSLDELPQLLNVLKGDMSIVGNRPLPVEEAKSIFPMMHTNKRFYASAGITGLWQTHKEQGDNPYSRAIIDGIYTEKESFLLDMYLIFITPKKMFKNY